MTWLGRNGFLAVAVAFHLIYVYSVFDTYFTSPIVHGMREHQVPGGTAPAKRLVLFVGDGLRADKAFQSFPDPSPASANDTDAAPPRPLMPFLRSKILHEGTFGVSHTRVPTESRPGHVALIAGLYEDVSAVTTGWKHNPVNFDSVFNRSRHTWSWGSPDILDMFESGAVPGRVTASTYAAEEEDFSGDGLKLDYWVFDRVKEFFRQARTNETLAAELRQDKLVFFLHLLGLDTNGHAKRPYSKEYLHNIQVVDKGVQEIVALMEDFYEDDGETAYVFTADHGMSDWGSHGDGHPDNTRTPLIAWGSGVAKPVISKGHKASGHDDFSADWGLDHVARHDMPQANIAALMAYLVGLAFPVNSVGELPLAYLSASTGRKAQALLTNAKAILEMYQVKEARKQRNSVRYVPYAGFIGSKKSISERIMAIEKLISSSKHQLATAECTKLIQLGLAGLSYLQTYDWLFLRTLVTTGYLGFVAFGIVSILDAYVLQGRVPLQRTIIASSIFSSVLVALFSYLYMQSSPWTYYAYAVFPVFFWEETFAHRDVLAQSGAVLFQHYSIKKHTVSFSLQALAFVGLLQALVWSYSNRTIYTICYALGAVWPLMYGSHFVRNHFSTAFAWMIASASMSIFTLLPANKVENIPLIMIGGALMTMLGLVYLVFQSSILGQDTSALISSRRVLGLQLGLVPLAMITTYHGASSIQAEQGLPLGTQVVGWMVLLASLGLPFLHAFEPLPHYLHRYFIIFLTFAPSFVILTISWEGLFYVAFCATLLAWVQMEHLVYADASESGSSGAAQLSSSDKIQENGVAKVKKSGLQQDLTTPAKNSTSSTYLANANASAAVAIKPYRPLTIFDIRPSLFTLYFLQSAFFSTGNIASISSFSLDAVFRLIPVFDPFSQGALLIFKILTPFVLLSAALGILNQRLGFAPGALFMGLIVCGDWLTINFFWMVRDEGSWLEIGETISRFCIVSALCVFAAALEGASTWLVGDAAVAVNAGEPVDTKS